MRVFVFEHVCGGGMARQNLDGALVRQGAAVLGAVVEDFLRAGVMVLTTVDQRLDLPLDGAQVLRAGEGDSIEQVIDQLAAEADWALVIAPEFDGVLESWSLKLTAAGAKRLGSRPDAIALCADKLAFGRAMRAAGVPTPPTWRLEGQQTIERPVVVKRRRGAGCEDVFVVRNREEVADLPFGRDWIVQPLVEGRALTCSFVVHGAQQTALPVVEQVVKLGKRIVFEGGRMPVDHAAAERALALARRAVGRVAGLRGFVGVDVIVSDDAASDVVLEMNARPTMAYVGLHRVCRTNLAMALVDPSAPLTWSETPLRYDCSGSLLS